MKFVNSEYDYHSIWYEYTYDDYGVSIYHYIEEDIRTGLYRIGLHKIGFKYKIKVVFYTFLEAQQALLIINLNKKC